MGKRLLKPEAMARIERLYDRHGTWGIFLSRFVPGARAVIPPFAGVAGLKSVRVLAPMILASGIWYGTLTFIAANLIPRLDDVATLVSRMNWVGLWALGVIVVVVGAYFVFRMRRKTTKGPQDHSS
jgi:membrane protein DedA with SNARE-associated domain